MASHFSDIGFSLNEENFETEMEKIIAGNIDHAAKIDSDNGPYLVVPIDNAIELWFPFDNNTINPYTVALHYQTKTFLEVEKVAWTNEDDGKDGLCSVFLPDHYPFNVTIPAPGLAPEFQENKRYKCQTACFAEDIFVYKDADDFHKNSDYGDDFSENMFFPSGTFVCQEPDSRFSSCIVLSGTVKSVKKQVNSFTKNEYYIITAETFGGEYDLLVDPELLPDGISEGNIVYGDFWLSGKIMPVFHGDELINLKREKQGNPHLKTLGDLYHILRHCWSAETAYPSCQKDWCEKDRTFGQCAITAMLVHDMFGGTIHKVRQNGGTHYFNKINGQYVDLTSEQFELYCLPVDYDHNIEVDRLYCGKNPDTKKRYQLLVKNIAEYLKAAD